MSVICDDVICDDVARKCISLIGRSWITWPLRENEYLQRMPAPVCGGWGRGWIVGHLDPREQQSMKKQKSMKKIVETKWFSSSICSKEMQEQGQRTKQKTSSLCDQWTDHSGDIDSLWGRECLSSSFLFFHRSNIDNSFHFSFSLLKYESRSIVA